MWARVFITYAQARVAMLEPNSYVRSLKSDMHPNCMCTKTRMHVRKHVHACVCHSCVYVMYARRNFVGISKTSRRRVDEWFAGISQNSRRDVDEVLTKSRRSFFDVSTLNSRKFVDRSQIVL